MSAGHYLIHTSPKGGEFLGACLNCEATDLPPSRAGEPCPNVAGRSGRQSLLAVIGGGQ